MIGNNNVLSSYSAIAGRVKIGEKNFFSLHSAVIPRLSIGNENVIQAGMIVDKDVFNNTTVFHRFKEKVFFIK